MAQEFRYQRRLDNSRRVSVNLLAGMDEEFQRFLDVEYYTLSVWLDMILVSMNDSF